MPSLLDTIKQKLATLSDDWKAKRSDGKITLSEFSEFTRKAVEEAMSIVAPLRDGAQKKALVLEFAGQLFDWFAPLIKSRMPAWLRWIAFFLGGEDLRDEFLQGVNLTIEIFFVEKFKAAL